MQSVTTDWVCLQNRFSAVRRSQRTDNAQHAVSCSGKSRAGINARLIEACCMRQRRVKFLRDSYFHTTSSKRHPATEHCSWGHTAMAFLVKGPRGQFASRQAGKGTSVRNFLGTRKRGEPPRQRVPLDLGLHQCAGSWYPVRAVCHFHTRVAPYVG